MSTKKDSDQTLKNEAVKKFKLETLGCFEKTSAYEFKEFYKLGMLVSL